MRKDIVMNIAEYTSYISASLEKGTIGAYISVGLFAFVGICLLFGAYFGSRRGFSKSVIRLFIIGAAAVVSFLSVSWIAKLIVDNADKVSDGGTKTLDQIIESYFPEALASMPDIAKDIMSEVQSTTATSLVLMILTIILCPVLIIAIFYLLKTLTTPLYHLLSGLAGVISFGKGIVSTLLGAAVGVIQGAVIAIVIIFPVSGLCGVAVDARAPLLENTENPNAYIEYGYTAIIDDLADNPLFETVNLLGGEALYEDLITVKIDGEKVNMGEKCIASAKVVADMLPFIDEPFDYAHPSDSQRTALNTMVADIGGDEFVASLTADLLRGVANAEINGKINLGMTEATKALLDDIMIMFTTSTADTVEGDLDVVIDVYFILCDRHLFESFDNGNHRDMRDLLTAKDENGVTNADAILGRLKEYDRAAPIVTSFTKISLSVMHGNNDFNDKADELYETVKGDVAPALTHNKSDFATEEEYREAVTTDIDQALAKNNITVSDDVKSNMVDYIADNYGDYEGEITDKEINDALLSYYQAYAATQNKTEGEGSTEGGAE